MTQVDRFVAVAAAAAPPLTDEQRTRLAALLTPVPQPSHPSPRAPVRRAA